MRTELAFFFCSTLIQICNNNKNNRQQHSLLPKYHHRLTTSDRSYLCKSSREAILSADYRMSPNQNPVFPSRQPSRESVHRGYVDSSTTPPTDPFDQLLSSNFHHSSLVHMDEAFSPSISTNNLSNDGSANLRSWLRDNSQAPTASESTSDDYQSRPEYNAHDQNSIENAPPRPSTNPGGMTQFQPHCFVSPLGMTSQSNDFVESNDFVDSDNWFDIMQNQGGVWDPNHSSVANEDAKSGQYYQAPSAIGHHQPHLGLPYHGSKTYPAPDAVQRTSAYPLQARESHQYQAPSETPNPLLDLECAHPNLAAHGIWHDANNSVIDTDAAQSLSTQRGNSRIDHDCSRSMLGHHTYSGRSGLLNLPGMGSSNLHDMDSPNLLDTDRPNLSVMGPASHRESPYSDSTYASATRPGGSSSPNLPIPTRSWTMRLSTEQDAEDDSTPVGKVPCSEADCKRKVKPPAQFCKRHQEKYDRNHAEAPNIRYLPDFTYGDAMRMAYPQVQGISVNTVEQLNRLPAERLNAWQNHIHGLENQWTWNFLQAAMYDIEADADENEDATKEDGVEVKWNKFYIEQQRTFFGKARMESGHDGRYTVDWINARMRMLFRSIYVFHYGGRAVYPIGGDNGGYGKADMSLSFDDRLKCIEGLLKQNKLVTMNVIEGRGVVAMVQNPDHFKKRKTQNKQSNKKKDAALEQERERQRGLHADESADEGPSSGRTRGKKRKSQPRTSTRDQSGLKRTRTAMSEADSKEPPFGDHSALPLEATLAPEHVGHLDHDITGSSSQRRQDDAMEGIHDAEDSSRFDDFTDWLQSD